MNILQYLQEKYEVSNPSVMTALEAKVFRIPYPLQNGWLEKFGAIEITPEKAATLAAKLYQKGINSGNVSKSNYCLAGASILRRIAKEAQR